MKLKNSTVIQLLSAIERLPALKNAPKATYALARNLTKLKPLRQDVWDTRQKLFEEHFGLAPGQKYNDKYPLKFPDGVTTELAQQLAEDHLRSHPKYPEVDTAFQKVLDMDSDFEPYSFPVEELNLEENSLSVVHLEMLLPLIRETPGKNGTP